MQDLIVNMLEAIIPLLSKLDEIVPAYDMHRNILSILGLETKEVEMCKVLWAILDYRVNNQRIYIPGFVRKVLKLDLDAHELDSAVVYREFYIPENEKRIDLVIETASLFIPIEAKIYADDQTDQCKDYLEFAEKYMGGDKRSFMYYLTLDKHSPTEKSISYVRELYERIETISWKDVLIWLENEKIETNISNVVEQYINALTVLTNEDKKEYDMEIEAVLNSPERIRAALELEKGLKEKKIGLMKLIFSDINDKVTKILNLNYDFRLNDPWPLKEAIESYYSKKLSSSTFPALTYNMGHLFTDSERANYYLVLRFEIEWRPYIGFGVMKLDPSGGLSIVENYSDELFPRVKERINCSEDIKLKKGWWIKWEYVPSCNQIVSEDVPNFREFNASYISLFDTDNRRAFVNKVVNCLKIYSGMVLDKQ